MAEISLKPAKYSWGMHPNSRKNLKMFPKGYNGNHQGSSLLSQLKTSLDKPLKKPSDDASVRDHLVYSTLAGAIKREPTPFKEVWDRVEGKVEGQDAIVRDINVVFIIGKGYRESGS